MANFTTALLGSFSRILFSPASSTSPSPSPAAPSDLGFGFASSSQSDPDIVSRTGHARDHLRPASAHVRPRPSSAAAVEGYWSWEDGRRILRRGAGNQHQRDVGLKGLADVQITHTLPILACPPLPLRSLASASGSLQELDIADAADRTADDSFSYDVDISLISDTSTTSTDSTTSASDEHDEEFGFLAPSSHDSGCASGLGLGLGLLKADGSPFDGLGVLSFGCSGVPRTTTRTRTQHQHHEPQDVGVSRAFLEEVAWTFAVDPHHRILSVILEEDCEEGDSFGGDSSFGGDTSFVGHGSTSTPQRPTRNTKRTSSKHHSSKRGRDLSTVDTISSGLKKRGCVPLPSASSSASAGQRPKTPGHIRVGTPMPMPTPARSSSSDSARSPTAVVSFRRQGAQRLPLPVWRV
ncbi:hypothetical protein C8R46DRAFT_1035406 [Mycena filopes]|nr:hypothetical protein C8R46DRAFT_1035406 [Mycena filopes]